MKLLLVLLLGTAAMLLARNSIATVGDMGYCPDVGSQSCEVRDYWPRRAGDPTGVSTYWLSSDERTQRVCFVTLADYNRAVIGYMFNCDWLPKRGDANARGAGDSRQSDSRYRERALDRVAAVRMGLQPVPVPVS